MVIYHVYKRIHIHMCARLPCASRSSCEIVSRSRLAPWSGLGVGVGVGVGVGLGLGLGFRGRGKVRVGVRVGVRV